MSVRHLRLHVSNGTCVHIMVREPEGRKQGCVVFSHGFNVSGYESRRMFWEISGKLGSMGFLTVLFDYRGSGYSDLLFQEMTIDTEIQDLNCVIDFVYNDINEGDKLILWGQSLGSGVASLVTSTRPEVEALVLWCLSAELFERYTALLGPEIYEKGYVFSEKGYKVNKAFLDSLKDKDVYRAIKQIKVPVLFVHGTEDKKASVRLTDKAFGEADCSKEKFIVDGGNHGFKCQPDLFEKAVKKTFDWLKAFKAGGLS